MLSHLRERERGLRHLGQISQANPTRNVPLDRSIQSIYPRDQLIRHLPLHLFPLLAVPLRTVLVHGRDRARAKVPEEETPDQRTPEPAARRHGKARPPHGVRAVVDRPCQAEQAPGVRLALILWIVLEALALHLGDRLHEDPGRVERQADVHAPRRRVGRVLGRDAEEHGVDDVVDEVEERDDRRAVRRHLLLGRDEDPEDLFDRGAQGHEEEDGLEGGQVEAEGGDEVGARGVADWGWGPGPVETQSGEDGRGQWRAEEDESLDEGLDTAEADECRSS